MAKKKKKSKKEKKPKEKKPKEKKPKEKKGKKDQVQEKIVELQQVALDAALSSSKNTESTLLDLLHEEPKKVIEKKNEQIDSEQYDLPTLSYDSNGSKNVEDKVVQNYLMEDVPITKQPRKAGKRTKLVLEKPEEEQIPIEEEQIPVEEENIPTASVPEKVQELSPEEDVYFKLTGFFEKLFNGYIERYDFWEHTENQLLSILRKMRKITKKNTEDLVSSITNLYEKVQDNLENFKLKQNAVEKVAEVNIENMSGEFKRVLGLLELQIKEYQLKKITDEYMHEKKLFL